MKRTVGFIVLMVAIIAAYDTWTLAVNGYETTISAVLGEAAKQWPIICGIAGILFGHLWFPNRIEAKRMEKYRAALVAIRDSAVTDPIARKYAIDALEEKKA